MKRGFGLLGYLLGMSIGTMLPMPLVAATPTAALPAVPTASPPEALAQLPAVDELSDISPSHWAYQALKSLVERYELLVGYPDSTFRGDRPLSRYEFAVILQQALAELAAQIDAKVVSAASIQEDLDTINRLQAMYVEIAASLRDRLDALEPRVEQLSQTQFSTTTKLRGQTVGGLTDGTNARASLIARTRLTLHTSFTGRDQLVTQLEMGNDGQDSVGLVQSQGPNLLGTLGWLADGGSIDYQGVSPDVRLSQLHYTWRPTTNVQLTLGARLSPRDFIDANPFADASATNFASSFFAHNPLIVQNEIDRPGGAGAAVTWQPSLDLPLMVRALYVATDAAQPTEGATPGGLFGDRAQGSVEVQYDFQDDLSLRLQYTRAAINGVDISAGGLNLAWRLNRHIGVFARLGLGRYEGTNVQLNQRLDLTPLSWMLGVTVRNIVIPGSTAGLAIGQPFVEADLGTGTQTNFEAYYSFQFNDHISFTPSLIVVDNPDNQARGTNWQWLIRLVYAF